MRERRPSPVAAPHFSSVPAGGCQSRRDPALPGAAPELQGRGSMNIKRLWHGTAHQTASGLSLVCKSGRCFLPLHLRVPLHAVEGTPVVTGIFGQLSSLWDSDLQGPKN